MHQNERMRRDKRATMGSEDGERGKDNAQQLFYDTKGMVKRHMVGKTQK